MPIYEFACGKCHHTFEELVPVNASAPCPTCGSKKVNRAVSAPAAHAANSSEAQGYTPPSLGRKGACGHGGCGHC